MTSVNTVFICTNDINTFAASAKTLSEPYDARTKLPQAKLLHGTIFVDITGLQSK